MPKSRPALSLAKSHQQRVERYLKEIKKRFDNATKSYVALSIDVGYKGDGVFSFSDYPQIGKQVSRITDGLDEGINSIITGAAAAEWSQGEKYVNDLIQKVSISQGQSSTLMALALAKKNDSAAKAFIKRDLGSTSVMQKVRTIAYRHKIETEIALSISNGRSAEETAKLVMKYINNRQELFKTFKSQHGSPRLSRATKHYYSSVGPTNGSYYDALRLVRTEVNMAFRNAEIESFRDKDWIVGYHVHRSAIPYDCDVCDALVGDYPKWFNYSGGHPNCRCYITAITYTEDEMEEYFANGMKPIKSVNEVNELPEGLSNWIGANAQRIAKAEARGTLPYFISDNKHAVDNIRLSRSGYYPIISQSNVDTSLYLVNPDTFIQEVYIPASRDKDIMSLLQRYESLPLGDKDMVSLRNEIIEKVISFTRQELETAGYVKGMRFLGYTPNYLYGVAGQNGLTKNLYCDIISYGDKSGKIFSYSLGSDALNAKFNAVDASKALANMKPLMGDTIKRVVSINFPDPYDAFYKKAYSGFFNRADMYSGESVHVFTRIEKYDELYLALLHEASHNLDLLGIKVFGQPYSSLPAYVSAIAEDNYWISDYARADKVEDFAEHFAACALCDSKQQELFSRIPNRVGVFRAIFGKDLPF